MPPFSRFLVDPLLRVFFIHHKKILWALSHVPVFTFQDFLFTHTDVAVSRFFFLFTKITFFEMAQNWHFLVIFSGTVRPTELKTLLYHLRTISFHIELGFSYSDHQPSLKNRVRSVFLGIIHTYRFSLRIRGEMRANFKIRFIEMTTEVGHRIRPRFL